MEQMKSTSIIYKNMDETHKCWKKSHTQNIADNSGHMKFENSQNFDRILTVAT